jgi:two-component system, response regulator PdtaR
MSGVRMAGGTGSVVIVEDEELLAELAVEIVNGAGCDAISFRRAEDAIAYLTLHCDEVGGVFTDVSLAGAMTGMELVRHVAANWPWMHLLIASGVIQPAPEAMPPNARFVAKPWRAAHLENFVT